MDILAYILAVIAALVLAGASMVYNNSRSSAIWIFCTGGVIAVVGACCYWQDSEWKRELKNPEVTSKSDLGEVATYITQTGAGNIVGNNNNVTIISESKKPRFSETVDLITVSLGVNGFTCSFLPSLKGSAAGVLLNLNGHKIKGYLSDGVLCVDAEIIEVSSNSVFRLVGNNVENRPPGWDENSNDRAIEIVDEQGVPRFQLIYLTPSSAMLKGIFSFGSIAILADDNGMRDVPADTISSMPYNCEPIFLYPSWKHPGEFRK